MATIITYITRQGPVENGIVHDIRQLNSYLSPPGITPRDPLIKRRNGLCLAVLDPTPNIEMSGTAVSVGMPHHSGPDWAEPQANVPDGSFCLVRANDDTLQLVTDPAGSRTIWYLLTSDYFIASTSQRAIVVLAKSFRQNILASAWMLSTGALGPGYSWDERFRMVPPNSILSLNMSNWTLHETGCAYEYCAEKEPEDHFRESLLSAFDEAFSIVGEYSPDWIIPLSGGVDSRGILLWLPEPRRFQYVTWGTPDAVNNPKSDASVAARLAEQYNLTHRYNPLGDKIKDPASFFNKFLASGEGRISHISGYLDDFAFWESLHRNKCPGVMRGDQMFGGPSVRRAIQVRQLNGLCTFSDFPAPFGSLGEYFHQQQLPPHLIRRSNETLNAWRCRTEMHYRAPVVRAALNQLKCAYTDVVSPFQNRAILNVIVRMPDAMRTNKKLFAKLVSEREPNIPFAKNTATKPATDVIVEKNTHDFLMDEISSGDSDVYLPAKLLRHIRNLNLTPTCLNNNGGSRNSTRSVLQRSRILLKKYFGGAEISAPQLLLRSYLSIASSRMLAKDAHAFGTFRSKPSWAERGD